VSQKVSKKVCFILGALALWLSPAPCQVPSPESGLQKAVGSRGGGLAAGSLRAAQSPLPPLPPRRETRRALADGSASRARSAPVAAAGSCLNTSSKVLSWGFVIPEPPFISRGGGGQAAICSICSWAAPGSAVPLGAAATGALPEV